MSLTYFLSTFYDYEQDSFYQAPSYVITEERPELALAKLSKADLVEGNFFALEQVAVKLYGTHEAMGFLLDANPLLHPNDISESLYVSIQKLPSSPQDTQRNAYLLGERLL